MYIHICTYTTYVYIYIYIYIHIYMYTYSFSGLRRVARGLLARRPASRPAAMNNA